MAQKSILLFNLFFLGTVAVLSQVVSLQGKVLSSSDDGAAEEIKLGVYISNLSNTQVKISDENGEFEIQAELNDVLLFQSYLYNQRQVVVSQRILDRGSLDVFLTENVVELDESVFGDTFKPYLKEEVELNQVDLIVDQIYKDLGINPDVKVKQNVKKLGFRDINPLRIDVGRIVSAISGDTRRLRTLYQYEEKQKIIQHIIEYLGEDFFFNDLKIKDKDVEPLVNFAYETSNLKELHAQASYLEIMKLLTNKNKIYQERLNNWED